MLTDPIADMLTRIRNATRVYKESTDVPASRFKEEILRILAREGFIKGYERVDVDGKPYLRVYLKYGPRRQGDDLHEALLAKLPGHGAEDAGAAGLQLVVDDHGGVVVKADGGAVGALDLLLGAHHHGLDHVPFLDRPPRGPAGGGAD